MYFCLVLFLRHVLVEKYVWFEEVPVSVMFLIDTILSLQSTWSYILAVNVKKRNT